MTPDPPFRVTVSGCCHAPPADQTKHMCIWEQSLWLAGPDGQWWRVGLKSRTRADHILSVCATWDDVLTMRDDLWLLEPGWRP